MKEKWVLGAVGDVFLNRSDGVDSFKFVRPIFNEIDLVFGNCEGAYSDYPRSVPTASGFRLVAPQNQAELLEKAGFDVLSLANNHALDAGYEGLNDTIQLLKSMSISTVGAGKNLAESRKNARCTVSGQKVAFLAFTSVYPAGYEARDVSAGVSPMRVHTHYHVHPEAFGRVEPGADPAIRTFPFPEDLNELQFLVEKARSENDVVIVSFHWGKSTKPAILMDYEFSYGRAAINAGADIVLGHHHHLIRGIEIYRGKPIFFGLGHFAFDMGGLDTVLSARQIASLKQFGEYAIYPREGYPLLPFNSDARRTIIGLCWFEGAKFVQAGVIPCVINAQNQPVPIDIGAEEGKSFLNHLEDISESAELSTGYSILGPSIGGFQAVLISKALSL